jgi:hypothetical protein
MTFRIAANVESDRRVVLTLPPEAPTGPTELVVTLERPSEPQSRVQGVPAASIRGIGAGKAPQPDDATIERWLDEHRKEKYG